MIYQCHVKQLKMREHKIMIAVVMLSTVDSFTNMRMLTIRILRGQLHGDSRGGNAKIHVLTSVNIKPGNVESTCMYTRLTHRCFDVSTMKG